MDGAGAVVEEEGDGFLGALVPVLLDGVEGAVHGGVAGAVGDGRIGPVAQQQLCQPGLPVAAGIVQRRVVLTAGGTGVGTGGQQPFGHPVVALGLLGALGGGAGGVQGGLALAGAAGGVGAVTEVQLHVGHQPLPRRHVQGRQLPVTRPQVHPRPVRQQQLRTPGGG